MPLPNVSFARACKQVLAVLRDRAQPLDAYQLARVTGLTAMTAGRALVGLAEQGVVRPVDELGTANDLAARYELVGRDAGRPEATHH
jgi:pyocin large subunit-like protein